MIYTKVEILKMSEENVFKVKDHYNYFEVLITSEDEKGRKVEYITPLPRTCCLVLTEAIESGVKMTQDAIRDREAAIMKREEEKKAPAATTKREEEKKSLDNKTEKC